MRQFYLILFSLLVPALYLGAQSILPEKVSVKLLEKVGEEADAFHSVHIVLADRVNLAEMDALLTAQRASASVRAEAVIEALKTKAHETQGDLLDRLQNSPLALPGSVKSYWIANAVFARAKKEMIAELSRRPDVAWIGLNGKLELTHFEETPLSPPPMAPNGREPGLSVIKAPAMWAMGYTGYGRTAFTNDTGIDPSHPALATRYRGLYVPAEHTWFELDPGTLEQSNNSTPYDCGLHGTHVNGTILGLDRMRNDTIGAAFNAHWIGSAILCGIGTEDNVGAFQWALDPDGDPASTDDMPDVINNSWYDPNLDTLDCFSVYVPVLEALEAAGVAVVFSAGNAGPDVMTITPPHNINVNEVNSFTVGALNGNNANLPIANFSSRGPSHCGGTGSLLIKPEVSAPGVSVRSCIPGGYTFLNGTSMAAPHVSGAILLLKEAFPNATGKELKLAIYHTCTDLGEPGEDNTFGMGVINVLAAFDYMVAQGHVPVSPFVANDVLLVEARFPLFSCEMEIRPFLTVENAGTDTLYTFDVHYEAGQSANTWQWAGALAPRQRASFTLPALMGQPGEQLVKLLLENPNGTADERPLNNRFQKKIHVSERERFHAKTEGAPGVVCEGSSALLRHGYNGPGTAIVKWYDAPFDGNELGEGPVFVTPSLDQPAVFYADAIYNVPIGPKNTTIGNTGLDETQGLGLTLQVHAPVTLKSMKIFTDVVGGRAFALLNNKGETVHQRVLPVSSVGEFKINLDWHLQPGEYTLIKTLGKPVYHNTTGAAYPYSVPDILDITGTNDGAGPNGVWYYFYDLLLEYDEPCGRTPVVVETKPGGPAPIAAFIPEPDSVDLAHNVPVLFTNTSGSEATTWTWNFGDGNASDLEHPEHTYSQAGSYVVSLVAADQEGCTDHALATVLVTESSVSAIPSGPVFQDHIAVWPNPVREAVSVHLKLTAAKPVVLCLNDLAGRPLRTATSAALQDDVLRLDTTGLPGGVYFLWVKAGEGTSVWKVVKM